MKIIKIPLNCGALSKKEGIEKAPDEIIKEFDELFLNENFEEPKFSVESVEINNSNIDEAHEKILAYMKKSFDNKNKEKICIIGGDHSLTYSTIKAYEISRKRSKEKTLFIIFDAHPDLEDSEYSHEDYLRNLIKNRIISSRDVILVGLRSFSKNEVDYLKSSRIKYYSMKQIMSEGIKEIKEELLNLAKDYDSLYLSIDIDAVDPAFAPGTGYIEPGGLTSRELIFLLQSLREKTSVFEVVEVNPLRDANRLTTKLAAKIIWELF